MCTPSAQLTIRLWFSFPLGSPARERTLADRAIDTLSTTVGLVTFQEVASHCSDGIYAQVTETEEDEEFTDGAFADMLTKDTTMETVSYKTVPPWKKHPHIITRWVRTCTYSLKSSK